MTAQVGPTRAADPARARDRRWPVALRRAARWARERDLAVAYGLAVVVTCLVLSLLGNRRYHQLVIDSSTNLANLHHRPWLVLAASAFVVSSPWGLWLVPFLVVGYGAAQRWVGRLGAVVVGLLGHVGGTLVVATVLTAGISHGWWQRALVDHLSDVGVSYGLMAVAGFLVVRVPRRWRWPYVAVVLGYIVVPFVLSPNSTGIGHLVAWSLGVAVAVLVARAVRATTAPSVAPAD